MVRPWKAGNYLGTGIGIVFVTLERRILDGKPGVSGRDTSPGLVFHRAKGKAAIFYMYATNTSERTTRTCSMSKPVGRDTGVAPRVTSHSLYESGFVLVTR